MGTINWVEVEVAVTHTWVGDLIYTLTHDSTTVALMDQPGRPPNPNVLNFFGDSSNLSANTPITFSDNDGKGQNSSAVAESMGANPGPNLFSDAGTCIFNETIGSSTGCGGSIYIPHQSLNAFSSKSSNGTWTLNISDNAPVPLLSNTGFLVSWTLRMDITSVPEPASLALLGAGLIGFGFMRRRKA